MSPQARPAPFLAAFVALLLLWVLVPALLDAAASFATAGGAL